MSNVAVCFFGSGLHTEYLKIQVNEILKNYDVFFFEEKIDYQSEAQLLLALRKVSIQKKCFNIDKNIFFEFCIAINSDTQEILNEVKIVDVIKKSTVYYTRGGWDQKYYSTHASINLFYAESFAFDRACEMYENIKYFRIKEWRGYGSIDITLNHKFYYHLKSMMLETECINAENSDLFKRTT